MKIKYINTLLGLSSKSAILMTIPSNFFHLLLIWFVLIIACIANAIAHAEINNKSEKPTELPGKEGRQPSGRTIEEIVVSAQRREQSVQDVPITMSVFTGDQLKSFGVVDTRDLDKIVPGFKYADSGFNVPIFSLRGVGLNERSQTASATVGIYVDEFNLPFPVMAKGPNLDIQRIEVLKGPQGTLFGRNTTAGAINYISNKPSDDFHAGFSASYARFETTDIEGYVSGPILSNMNLRFAFRQIESKEGWQKSLTRPDGPDGELGRKDKLSGRLSAVLIPTDTLDVYLSVDAWRDQSDAQAPAPLFITAANGNLGDVALSPRVRNHPTVPFDTEDMRQAEWPDQSQNNIPRWKYNDTFIVAKLRFDWSIFQNATMTYLGSYGKFESDESAVPFAGLSVLNLDGVFEVNTSFWNQELRLVGDGGQKFDYLFGVYISHDKADEIYKAYVGTGSVLFPHGPEGNSIIADRIDGVGEQVADTEAVFANIGWEFTRSFRVSAGARYTREKQKFEGCTRDSTEDSTPPPRFADLINILSISEGGSGGAGPGDCTTLSSETRNPGIVRQSRKDDNVSGKLSLEWTPREEYLFYLSFSRGFKSGGFASARGAEERSLSPAEQERLDSWELGSKLSFRDRLLQLNIAAFHYDYRDKQLVGNLIDPNFGVLVALLNAPESRVVGGEMEMQATLIRNFDILLSASYVDTEIRKFTSINQDGENEDFSGNRFNFAPRWTTTASVRYRWLLPSTDALEMGWGLDYSYSGQTNAQLSEDPFFKLASYYNVDYRMSIGHVDRSWKITFWGRNVTNEYQPTSTLNTSATDSIVRFAKMPQTYGVTFSYDYK